MTVQHGPSMADSATLARVAAQLGCGNWGNDRVVALAQPAAGLAAPHVRCGSAGRSMQIRVQAGGPMLVWGFETGKVVT